MWPIVPACVPGLNATRAGSHVAPPFVVREIHDLRDVRLRVDLAVVVRVDAGRRQEPVPDRVDEVRVVRVRGDRLLVERVRVVGGDLDRAAPALTAVDGFVDDDRVVRVEDVEDSEIAYSSPFGAKDTQGSEARS